MIVGKLFMRLTGRKVRPDRRDDPEFEVVRNKFELAKPPQSIGKNDKQRQTRVCIGISENVNKNHRSTTTTSTSSSSFSDEMSHRSQHLAPRVLPDVCAQFKGRFHNVDRYLTAIEKVEEIVWSSMMMDDISDSIIIQFNSLDASTVPPPDLRSPASLLPVEALLKVMLMVKDSERLIQEDPDALEYIGTMSSTLSKMNCDQRAKDFLLQLFNHVQHCDEINEKHIFDDEILNRISSVIRFHLRAALNSAKGFSPIVLAHNSSPSEYLLDGKDVPHMELNIAALFHSALLVVHEGLDEDYSVQEALKLRSAKRFILNVLSCAKRIDNVDEKRRKAWHHARRWAAELKRVFPDDMCEIALLADVEALMVVASQKDRSSDLMLIESHRSGLKDKRGTAQDLRASRATMTGLCGRNSCYPEVVFILDA